MLVALTTVTLVPAVAPKRTAVAPVKPVPVMVVGVPPRTVPVLVLRNVTVGMAA